MCLGQSWFELFCCAWRRSSHTVKSLPVLSLPWTLSCFCVICVSICYIVITFTMVWDVHGMTTGSENVWDGCHTPCLSSLARSIASPSLSPSLCNFLQVFLASELSNFSSYWLYRLAQCFFCCYLLLFLTSVPWGAFLSALFTHPNRSMQMTIHSKLYLEVGGFIL